MPTLKLNILLSTAVLLSLSCVETTMTVRVMPDGRYAMHFHTIGDSGDVHDEDFPHPVGAGWTTRYGREVREGDSLWVQDTEGLREGKNVFSPDTLSPVALRHPIRVEKAEGWFSTRYRIEQVFAGRGAFAKYPRLARSLGRAGEDTTAWRAEALGYILNRALDDLQAKPQPTLAPLLKERIQNHLRGVLYRMEEQETFPDLSALRAFLQEVLKPFRLTLPPGFVDQLLAAAAIYQRELKVTRSLNDDSFNFHLFLPGLVTSTNADTVSGDTLKWSFGLEAFLNDDHVLQAESIIYHQRRLQTAALVAILILVAVLATVQLFRR